MKQLVLVRHAKSSWTDPSLGDFDRPLNRRGLRDAPRVGGRLLKILDGGEDLIIVSSPALRATSTAQILAAELGVADDRVRHAERLYPGDLTSWLQTVELLDDGCSRAILVGHNPGISEFAAELTAEPLRGMPTCGMVGIEFAVTSWVGVALGQGHLQWLDSPKRPGQL